MSRGWRRKAGDEGERRRKSEWRGRGGSENAQSYRVRRNRVCERTRLRPCIGGGPGVAIGTTQQPTQPRRTCGAEHGGPGTGGPSAAVAFQRLRQGTKCACLELIARARFVSGRASGRGSKRGVHWIGDGCDGVYTNGRRMTYGCSAHGEAAQVLLPMSFVVPLVRPRELALGVVLDDSFRG